MSTAGDVVDVALEAAKLLLAIAGTEERARELLTRAAAERGRAAADVLEVALYDEQGNPR